jgi:hypothetical protein
MPCCRNVAWNDCKMASLPPKPRESPPTLVNAAATLPCSHAAMRVKTWPMRHLA